MASNQLHIVKLQDETEGKLFALVLISGPAHGSTYLVKRSHHAMSERWVWEALARAGVPAADVISLLQNARDDFRLPVPYTVH